MSKRKSTEHLETDSDVIAPHDRHTHQPAGENADEVVFEDPFADAEAHSDDELEEAAETATSSFNTASAQGEGESAELQRVWRPGVDTIADGEQLQYSSSAYVMYHAMHAEWPCLSIDMLPDNLGVNRTRFPMTMYFVAGTQAADESANSVSVIKLSDLYRTQHDEDSGDEDDSDVDDDPILEVRNIAHPGGVNRIRVMPQDPHVVATWSDRGVVYLWDIRQKIAQLSGGTFVSNDKSDPMIRSFEGHGSEGFALDWSSSVQGRLVSGATNASIYVWDAEADSSSPVGASWTVNQASYQGHSDSVEDLQWSPTEEDVFASCSVDGTVRIWDTRTHSGSMLQVKASPVDVNVLSWNQTVSFLLASGSDDGSFKIWDLRNFKSDEPIAHFTWHQAPITSVQWDHNDENVLVVASADNTVTIWDMSLEEDADAQQAGGGAHGDEIAGLPPQLLFVHAGQQDIKEAHFHRQLPGVVITTAADGFNVFKPAIHATS